MYKVYRVPFQTVINGTALILATNPEEAKAHFLKVADDQDMFIFESSSEGIEVESMWCEGLSLSGSKLELLDPGAPNAGITESRDHDASDFFPEQGLALDLPAPDEDKDEGPTEEDLANETRQEP